ncbi:MAG: LysR family transcriptional regulator [Kofleriaceae bacterium]|nr:LysR family transcriptional regulator [Kofleriaceae bacterium]
MHWDDLRYILAVAQTGSLTAAGRQLGVAHSTVYRRIQQFEKQHKVRCFIKVAERSEVTEPGARLVHLATEMEERALQAERCLVSQDDTVRGDVIIAAPEAIGLLLCPQLPILQARYPKLTTHWRLSAEIVNVQRREADIALRVTAKPPPSLVGRKLVDIAFAIYGSQNYLREHPWTGIEDARWIVFDELLASSPQYKWEERNIPSEQIAMKVDRRVMFDKAVCAGLGVGVLPCADAASYSNIVRLSPVLPDVMLPLWILTHEGLREAPRVRAVMDFCVETICSQAPLLEGNLPELHE